VHLLETTTRCLKGTLVIPRTSVITDWRSRDEDLPDVAPGEEYECRIAPQKFVALRQIRVLNMVLVRLRIGAVEEVPFELESTDVHKASTACKQCDHARAYHREAADTQEPWLCAYPAHQNGAPCDCQGFVEPTQQRNYKPAGLAVAPLKKRLIATGAAVATADSIAITPGLEVCLVLRNEGQVPVKPRAALIVYEEIA
jgi:hypothetical protein